MSDQNETLYRISEDWHSGLTLQIGAINLGDALTYDILRVFGRLFKRHEEKHDSPDQTDEASGQ